MRVAQERKASYEKERFCQLAPRRIAFAHGPVAQELALDPRFNFKNPQFKSVIGFVYNA